MLCRVPRIIQILTLLFALVLGQPAAEGGLLLAEYCGSELAVRALQKISRQSQITLEDAREILLPLTRFAGWHSKSPTQIAHFAEMVELRRKAAASGKMQRAIYLNGENPSRNAAAISHLAERFSEQSVAEYPDLDSRVASYEGSSAILARRFFVRTNSIGAEWEYADRFRKVGKPAAVVSLLSLPLLVLSPTLGVCGLGASFLSLVGTQLWPLLRIENSAIVTMIDFLWRMLKTSNLDRNQFEMFSLVIPLVEHPGYVEQIDLLIHTAPTGASQLTIFRQKFKFHRSGSG